MKPDIEIHGQVVGPRDVRRALRGVEEKALHRALADTRRIVDKAVLAAVESILNTVGARWEKDDPSGLAVFVGFVEGPDYTVFQEEGTRKLRAMASLAKARAVVEDALDSHGNLVEVEK